MTNEPVVIAKQTLDALHTNTRMHKIIAREMGANLLSLATIVELIDQLHVPETIRRNICKECKRSYPCPTKQVIIDND